MKITRLKTRLAILFAVFALLAITTVSLLVGSRAVKQVETEIGSALGETAHLMADKLDHYMWSRYGETQILANLTELQNPENPEKISLLVNQLNATFPSFSWIGYTDPNGTVIASTDDILKGADISQRPVYMDALEKPFIGDVHDAVLLAELLPNPTGEKMKFVDISTPVFNDNKELVGVLAAHLSWSWLEEIRASMAETLENRKGVEFFIVSPQKSDIVVGPKDMLGVELHTKSMQLSNEGQNGWVREEWPDGKDYLTGFITERGYEDYAGLGWTVLVRQPVAEAYAPAKELLTYFISIGAIIIIMSALIGSVLAGWMTRPINEITRVARRLSAGENVEIPTYSGIREIEILSDSLRKMVMDLTESESALSKAQNKAHHDRLTGLPNRYGLDWYVEKIETEIDHMAILFLDLDGFKLINDTYGHEAGDKLLKLVAARLQTVIASDEFVARIGGDEFVMVLSADNDPAARGVEVGQLIIDELNKPFELYEGMVTIGCSVGSAVWTNGQDDIRETIRNADEALYEAKRTGKNRVVLSG